MDPNVKLDLAEDQGVKELENIKDYQAIVRLLMYATLATQPDISFAVAAIWRYSSCSFPSHPTTANRVLQYLKSTADL
jgi:ActR/RegA family two-component response regulator